MDLGKVGVAFNGGGFCGAFSTGFAKGILESGIKPTCIQGVSVGALSAAKIVESNEDELEKVWLEMEKAGAKTAFNWSDIAPNIFRQNPSLFYNSGVLRVIDAIDMTKVAKSTTQLQIITRNESKGNKLNVFFNSNPKFQESPELLKKAILASAALQGGLPPVEIDGEKHSDGLNYSLEHLIESGCDTIFLLLNDQADENQIRWYQRMSIPRHILSEENTELRLDKFLRDHKDFDVIFSDDDSNNDLPLIQRMKEAVKGARSVMSSAVKGDDINFVPHRIFVLNPRTPITTLSTLSFSKGDIKAAIEQGYDQVSIL